METKGGDIAITIDGYILWVRWNKRVAHYAVECTVYFWGDRPEDYKVGYFTFETTREVGACEVNCGGPSGGEILRVSAVLSGGSVGCCGKGKF